MYIFFLIKFSKTRLFRFLFLNCEIIIFGIQVFVYFTSFPYLVCGYEGKWIQISAVFRIRLGFGGTWTKRIVLRVLNMIYNFVLLVLTVFGIFSWIQIRIRIFPDRIRIFGRSGSGIKNKSLIRIREKNPDPTHCYLGYRLCWLKINNFVYHFELPNKFFLN